jgi:AcrR family transcriptional regulator
MPDTRAKRPRRKAKQARARETVGIVLEAAARVLRDHGYARATTNRIARTAGVSVGTLYEYFADKDEVFGALIQREIEALVAAVRGHALDPDAPVGEAITRLVVAAMGAMRYGPELFRSLEQVPGSSFRRHLGEGRRAVIAYVRHFLEGHRGELRVADLDLAAFMVVSAAEGVGGNATSDLFDERLARELSAMLTAYLGGAAGRRESAPRSRG